MGYVKNKTIGVGSWITLTKEISVHHGKFEKRTKVKIIGISTRGYDFEDEEGNRALEVGFDIGGLIE